MPLSDDLKPVHRLLVWRLVAAGGGDWMKSLSPEPKPSVRRVLVQEGLLHTQTLPHPKTKRSCLWIELTDAGWEWAERAMDHRIGAVPGAGEALQLILTSLQGYLQAQDLSAADLFRHDRLNDGPTRASVASSPQAKPPPAHPGIRRLQPGGGSFPSFLEEDARYPSGPAPIVEASIKRAYFELTEGRFGQRVRLANLRERVALPRHDFDAALARMVREDQFALRRLEDPGQITEEDEQAAMVTRAGGEHHLVFLKAY